MESPGSLPGSKPLQKALSIPSPKPPKNSFIETTTVEGTAQPTESPVSQNDAKLDNYQPQITPKAASIADSPIDAPHAGIVEQPVESPAAQNNAKLDLKEPWTIPTMTHDYEGGILDIDIFREARDSRQFAPPLDALDDIKHEGIVGKVRLQAQQIFNAILQTNDIIDGPSEGKKPQAAESINYGCWSKDLIWKLSFKVVMDVWKADAQPPVPEKLKDKAGKSKLAFEVHPDLNFNTRFSKVHRALWKSKAACKNRLDSEYCPFQTRLVACPDGILVDKRSQFKSNNYRREGKIQLKNGKDPEQPSCKKAGQNESTKLKKSTGTIAKPAEQNASQRPAKRVRYNSPSESIVTSSRPKINTESSGPAEMADSPLNTTIHNFEHRAPFSSSETPESDE